MLRKLMLIVLIGAAAAAHAADAYKWVDANGVVHYTDTAPAPEVKAQKVHMGGAKTQSSEAAPAAADDQKAVDAKAAPTTMIAANDRQDAEKRCQQARSSLELLQSNRPVGLDSGAGGKPVPLDAQARQQQVASLQSIIGTYCK